MPDDLYHRDILAWSEQQSERLRRVAAGERVNDVDWANVIEEIESLGRSELNAVRSLTQVAIFHALKIIAWPEHSARTHWRQEISTFLLQARLGYQPGMAQKLRLDDLYRRALRELQKTHMDGARPGPVPETCAMTPDDLLDEDFGPSALLARISPAATPPTPG